MRRTKSETIAEYRDEFLAGKSEEYKNKFDQKNENQQYVAIANWKRNAKNLVDSTKDLATVTAGTVVSYLKDAHKNLKKMATLTPKEAQKMQDLLDQFRTAIDNFDRMKKEQLLQTLKAEKEKIEKQGSDLDRKIADLQNELN